MIEEAWAALGGDPALLARLSVSGAPALGGPLPVDELAAASIGSALLAAAELSAVRGVLVDDVALDRRHAAVAFTSERHVRIAGEAGGGGFAPLSRFWRTADGWIRLHANYAHHERALLSVIGEPGRIARWRAVELEEAVVAAGGVGAAMRTADEWRAHPQATALAGLPLLDLEVGEAPGADPRPLAPLPAGGLPASGVRVLDLTRVIAGPVGTRTLGALGADVLRIDPPQVPELESQWTDSGLGKRSALLDLRQAGDRARFEELLGQADVLVHGYRPGALAALGLDPERLAADHPHLSTVTLSAWGDVGPWAHRRGFDSLVQSAVGIGAIYGSGDEPGVMPAQALDHATGYLIAAAALRALTERATHGRPAHARLALTRTARWLMDAPRAEGAPAAVDPAPYRSDLGDVSVIAPPGTLDGRRLGWPGPPPAYGRDQPAFLR